MPVPFKTSDAYADVAGHVSYRAFESTGSAACEAWLKAEVAPRVFDKELVDSFADDVGQLKSEGWETAALQQYLDAPVPEATFWDIGESIADLFLLERHGAHLFGNRRRDLRSEKGSLPGADIAGYQTTADGKTVFLFGEVKASGEAGSPPSVMAASGSGMVAQLTKLAMKPGARRQLLLYLMARRDTTGSGELWERALQSLGESKYALTGVLIRDSLPTSKDVEKAAQALRSKVPSDREISLFVLHLGIKVDNWSLHCQPS